MFCFICGNFSVKINNLASKSVLVIKFARAIVALQTSAANLLNSEGSIYLL